jgi:hypothetical protein
VIVKEVTYREKYPGNPLSPVPRVYGAFRANNLAKVLRV